jgi:hypothetical protein
LYFLSGLNRNKIPLVYEIFQENEIGFNKGNDSHSLLMSLYMEFGEQWRRFWESVFCKHYHYMDHSKFTTYSIFHVKCSKH